MSIVDGQDMLYKALSRGYAVGAFNITSLLDIKSLMAAAEEKRSPLIIQTTESVAKYISPGVITAVFIALAKGASVPAGLHLDHCTDIRFARQCAECGYTSIMFDGSHEKYEDNIRKTSQVVEYCHRLGAIYVEGELGVVGGREDQNRNGTAQPRLCDPEQALEFVKRTGVDWLAPAVGTVHGLYKNPNPKLDFDRLERIHELLNKPDPHVPLVIHGGTGIPLQSVKRLIHLGAAKFNVGTDLKKAKIDTAFDYISGHRHEYLPEKINPLVGQAVMDKVKDWMDRLDSSGRD